MRITEDVNISQTAKPRRRAMPWKYVPAAETTHAYYHRADGALVYRSGSSPKFWTAWAPRPKSGFVRDEAGNIRKFRTAKEAMRAV